MRLIWSSAALADVARLHDFLAPVNPEAAARIAQDLTAGPERLLDHPHIGNRVAQIGDQDIRRLLVGAYEVRYGIEGDVINIIRVWHGREDR